MALSAKITSNSQILVPNTPDTLSVVTGLTGTASIPVRLEEFEDVTLDAVGKEYGELLKAKATKQREASAPRPVEQPKPDPRQDVNATILPR